MNVAAQPKFGAGSEWAGFQPLYDPSDDRFDLQQLPEFRRIKGIFRRIQETQEISQRGLAACQQMIFKNPGDYSAWALRRKMLLKLYESPALWQAEELEFLNEITQIYRKCYQVWYHRRWLVETRGSADGELDYLATQILEGEDPKNFNAWQHRVFLLDMFPLIFDAQAELEFINMCLNLDARNNAVFVYRRYFLQKVGEFKVGIELDFSFAEIHRIPSNEAAWNYLLGLFWEDEEEGLAKVSHFLGEAPKQNRFWVEAHIRLLNLQGRAQEAGPWWDQLMEMDTLRTNYWKRMKQRALGDWQPV